MRVTRYIAAPIAVASLAMSLLVSPVPALAAGAGDTGNTDVTVQAGPGWGQRIETVEVSRGSNCRLAQTGDTAGWAPFLLLGAAALSGGLLVAAGFDDGKGADDGDQA